MHPEKTKVNFFKGEENVFYGLQMMTQITSCVIICKCETIKCVKKKIVGVAINHYSCQIHAKWCFF